jgi:hypothetical protein
MNGTIEYESGTFVQRRRHSHNGYYAGDFSAVPFHAIDPDLLLSLNGNAA